MVLQFREAEGVGEGQYGREERGPLPFADAAWCREAYRHFLAGESGQGVRGVQNLLNGDHRRRITSRDGRDIRRAGAPYRPDKDEISRLS